MKNLIRNAYFSIFILFLSSCSKDNSYYLFASEETASRFEANVFPVATKPAEISLGNELSVANVGETLTFFVPYMVVSDDVQTATISLTDDISGAVIREIPMNMSTDLSVLNVIVPEEIQGTNFLFASIPIENDMAGLSVTVSAKVTGNKENVEDMIKNAFRIQ